MLRGCAASHRRLASRAPEYERVVLHEQRGHAPVEGGTLASGPGEPARRSREPSLRVPDDVRLELVAHGVDLLLAINHEGLAAEQQEGFRQLLEICRLPCGDRRDAVMQYLAKREQ